MKEVAIRCLADVLFNLNERGEDKAMAFTNPKMSMLADWFEVGLARLHYTPHVYATSSQRRMILDAIFSFPFYQHMGWAQLHEASASEKDVVQLLTDRTRRTLEKERFLATQVSGSKLPKWGDYVDLLYRAARPLELLYIWAPALPHGERYKLFLESELVEGLTGFRQWLEDARKGMYDWDTRMLSTATEKKLMRFVEWLREQSQTVKPPRGVFPNIAFGYAPYCQTRFLYENHPEGRSLRLYEAILSMIRRRRDLRDPSEWTPPQARSKRQSSH